VADAPVDVLLMRIDDVAKGWLLALIEEAPLDKMPAILAAEIARDGPRLCAAVVRALGDDHDLDRLRTGAALEPLAASAGELAGADGLAAAALAIDALGGVVWSAVRAEWTDPTPEQVGELAERLSAVMEQVRVAVLRRLESGEAPPPVTPPVSAPVSAPVFAPVRGDFARAPVEGVSVPVEPAPEPAPSAEGGPLWLGALSNEVDRSRQTGAPLSLLLAELDDAERMLAVEDASSAESMFGRFAQSVRSAVRRQDTLACETDTRAWIIARDTGRIGAQRLAERVAEAVHDAPGWRGAPLGVTVGVAVLGEDGFDSTELVEAAEEARFVAEASGITVARADGRDSPEPPP
jgi:GGDEF domain-containing protein